MKESGVVISCFWHTDETVQREELGLGDAELKDFDFRNVTFYHISALAPARDDNQELNHTFIYSNGTLFRAPFNTKDVRYAIDSGTSLLIKK